jgi:hypothetical protein
MKYNGGRPTTRTQAEDLVERAQALYEGCTCGASGAILRSRGGDTFVVLHCGGDILARYHVNPDGSLDQLPERMS